MLRVANFVRHLMSSLECGCIGALIPAVQPRALAGLSHVGRCYMSNVQWHFSPDESVGSPDDVLHRWLCASSSSGRRMSLAGEKEWPWCDGSGVLCPPGSRVHCGRALRRGEELHGEWKECRRSSVHPGGRLSWSRCWPFVRGYLGITDGFHRSPPEGGLQGVRPSLQQAFLGRESDGKGFKADLVGHWSFRGGAGR